MKNFIIIGAAGYVAPRHLKAISETGNKLLCAYDKFDSVGVMDSFFPKADFFTEFERFDRHIEKMRRSGVSIDYLSVCSPNYLHDSHIRFGLRVGANVICEKPLVLNPWNVDALKDIEDTSGRKISTILQLRLHPSIIALKQRIENDASDKIYDIDLTYITSRGHWYYASWKGELVKSGGIATNIGVHFFDMLMWIFGGVKESKVYLHEHDRAAGHLRLERARVRWFLSINDETLPKQVTEKGGRTYRSLKIDDQEFEFSGGFAELHTRSYESILAGEGYGLEDSRPAIEVVHQVRHANKLPLDENAHPMASLPLSTHPFEQSGDLR